jgi:hypothetical protein
MDSTPVIDLTDAAHVALTSMLANGRVIGRDETGRKVIAIAVDDWVLDWFTGPDQAPTIGVGGLNGTSAQSCSGLLRADRPRQEKRGREAIQDLTLAETPADPGPGVVR